MHTARSISFLLLFIVSGILVGQDQEVTRKLQLAQSLEQAGDWSHVTILYEELVRTDPTSFVFFDGLRRAYTQTKQYDKAIALVERRLALRPGEAYLLAQLGGLTYDAGNAARADSLWKAALRFQPSNRQMIVLVAQQMQERRLYDRAIRTYTLGRDETKNPVDFVEELALLHSARQSYGAAVEEYLRLLRAAPHQLGYIQSRIASFTIKDEGVRQASAVVQAAVERSPGEVPLRSLRAWLAIERGDHRAALDEYRTIDRLSKANGAELYGFAQRAMREKAYRESAEAFRSVADLGTTSALTLPARLGYARAMEALAVRDTTVRVPAGATTDLTAESYPTLDRAVALYRELVKDAPNSDAAVQALYRIGMVAYERSFDLDGALAAFQQVQRLPRAGALGWEAALSAADVHIARNDLAGAGASLQSVPQNAPQEVRDRVIFKQAQVAMYTFAFDTALSMLGTLVGGVDRDLANDAIGLQIFLRENLGARPALTLFTRADLLQRQRKNAEALLQFQDVMKVYPNALLVDDAWLRTGELLDLVGRPSEAVNSLQQMFDEQKMSKLRDRALFRAGEITERSLHDGAKALEIYERFLQEFPHSLFSEEVRHRIRRLRGDAS